MPHGCSNRSWIKGKYGLVDNIKGKDQSEDLGVDGTITLEWILEK